MRFVLLLIALGMIFLLMPSGASYKQSLKFLFPIGRSEMPTKVNIVTYGYSYIYEAIKFNTHLATMKLASRMIKEGKIFDDDNTHAYPLPQVAESIERTINNSQEMIAELERTCHETHEYGTKTKKTDVETFISKDWFPKTDFYEISKLISLIDADKNYSINRTTNSDPQVTGLINNIILLDNAFGSFFKDLVEFVKFLQAMKYQTATEGLTSKFQEHFDSTGKDVNIDLLMPVYFRSEANKLNFEVKVTSYSDNENYEIYKSVPHCGYKVEKQYYSDLSRTKTFALECHEGLCYEVTSDTCGQALTSGEIDNILRECPVKRDTAEFEITDAGIFIYSEPNHELQKLLADHEITIDTYPTLIQFSGCYELRRGNILVSGCYNLPNQTYESKYDCSTVESYVAPSFRSKLLKRIMDIPLVALVLLLPGCAVLSLCILLTCLLICCASSKSNTHQRAPPRTMNQASRISLIRQPTRIQRSQHII